MSYNSEQEAFWAGDFGDAYIDRNKSKTLLASNLALFAKILSNTTKIRSCVEFGANIGMNLKALQLLLPDARLSGIEINSKACAQLSEVIGRENVFQGSIADYPIAETFDLALIKTVLIHINPDQLNSVYQKLFDSSNKYILIAEYYNPNPIEISYRGHIERLFKRDFAGEFLAKFSTSRLKSYGFAYKRDTNFPQDDISWFLIEK